MIIQGGSLAKRKNLSFLAVLYKVYRMFFSAPLLYKILSWDSN